MIKIKRISAFFICIFITVSCLFSESVPRKVSKGEEAWRYLKDAQEAYCANEYGTSFSLAENSVKIRKQDSKWQHYVLENALKKSKVRKAGDKLNEVLIVLKEQEQNEAYEIVNQHIEKKGIEYFENRFSKVMEYVDSYGNYPEADFLMGKIYRCEGEYEIALDYFNRAFKYVNYLDIPEVEYDILYELADLSYDLGNTDDYEKYLLMIIKDNSFYSDVNFMNALYRVVKEDSPSSVEKFFKLYRCDNLVGLEALISLSKYYLKEGLPEKALKASALASIIAVTRLDSFFSERLVDYQYSSFINLLNLCSNNVEVVDWGNENKIWQSFYDFAEISASAGSLLFARQMFLILSQYSPEEYWRNLAFRKIG